MPEIFFFPKLQFVATRNFYRQHSSCSKFDDFSQESKFPFQQRFRILRGHTKFIKRFFAQIRPPQNPTIFSIFSKFLPYFNLWRLWLKMCLILVHILSILHVRGRNFEDTQKKVGFFGGPISTKNLFINFLGPLDFSVQWSWNLHTKRNLIL